MSGMAPGEGHSTGDFGFAGDHRIVSILERGSYLIADPATDELHADLLEDINAESLVASIGFAVMRLDFLKDDRFQFKG